MRAVSVRLQWHIYANTGEGVVPVLITLSDPTGAYGVRRTDTSAVVVAAGTAVTDEGGGVYSYTFAEPAPDLTYEYFLRVREDSPESNQYYISGRVGQSIQAATLTTLYDVRKRVVDRSGRYDLVVDAESNDYSCAPDGIVDAYINDAQKWLDERMAWPKGTLKLWKALSANESMITFSQARYVKRVWHVASADLAVALPWRTWIGGLAPDQASLTELSQLPEYAADVQFGAHWPLNAIHVDPSDVPRTILIEAEWYSKPLVNDLDVSFWTAQHPNILCRATLMQMEIDMRNSQGVSDYATPLLDDIRQIHNNVAAENMANTMSGKASYIRRWNRSR